MHTTPAPRHPPCVPCPGRWRSVLVAAALAIGGGLALAACTQQPYQKDTNFTKYNYQYNK